jgi:16S rRNA (cytidine1402-2'-O)-methyltransferase
MACLYLVSTPIGNLEDITLRAIEVLGEVDFIACEDTRKTGLLLQKLKIKARHQLISYYEENEQKRIPQIINLLKEEKNVALVSSAGTPTISDPGFKLVRECINQGIKVESFPGASAILTALTSSGLPTDKFLFLGYLPKKQGKKKKVWELASSTPATVILFESPHRLVKSLQEIQNEFGDIEIVICRELTKVHEEIRREQVSQAIKHFEKTKPKGELTILLSLKNRELALN